eukprot:TRINITY_DN7437_c0_g1_i1.p1 TRINITY_DN7437_c0_g1~~TRINITY_DN7437_c0_g1_i1.p1  ORF type:complete len:794 (-),score=210.22 TRINITY_DN7437_c0_g1_i1:90-2471(-)
MKRKPVGRVSQETPKERLQKLTTTASRLYNEWYTSSIKAGTEFPDELMETFIRIIPLTSMAAGKPIDVIEAKINLIRLYTHKQFWKQVIGHASEVLKQVNHINSTQNIGIQKQNKIMSVDEDEEKREPNPVDDINDLFVLFMTQSDTVAQVDLMTMLDSLSTPILSSLDMDQLFSVSPQICWQTFISHLTENGVVEKIDLLSYSRTIELERLFDECSEEGGQGVFSSLNEILEALRNDPKVSLFVKHSLLADLEGRKNALQDNKSPVEISFLELLCVVSSHTIDRNVELKLELMGFLAKGYLGLTPLKEEHLKKAKSLSKDGLNLAFESGLDDHMLALMFHQVNAAAELCEERLKHDEYLMQTQKRMNTWLGTDAGFEASEKMCAKMIVDGKVKIIKSDRIRKQSARGSLKSTIPRETPVSRETVERRRWNRGIMKAKNELLKQGISKANRKWDEKQGSLGDKGSRAKAQRHLESAWMLCEGWCGRGGSLALTTSIELAQTMFRRHDKSDIIIHSALDILKQAREICIEHLGDCATLAQINLELAQIYKTMEKHKKQEEALKKAAYVFSQSNELRKAAICWHEISDLSLEKGHLQSASDACERAVSLQRQRLEECDKKLDEDVTGQELLDALLKHQNLLEQLDIPREEYGVCEEAKLLSEFILGPSHPQTSILNRRLRNLNDIIGNDDEELDNEKKSSSSSDSSDEDDDHKRSKKKYRNRNNQSSSPSIATTYQTSQSASSSIHHSPSTTHSPSYDSNTTAANDKPAFMAMPSAPSGAPPADGLTGDESWLLD